MSYSEDTVKRFQEIAGIENVDVASYYLELANGSIELAVTILMEDIDEDKTSGSTVPETTSGMATNTGLTVLEWNIQGLHPVSIQERMVAVVAEIKRLKPDVVMLQEVIQPINQYFQSKCDDYFVFSPPVPPTTVMANYFCSILLRKSTFSVTSLDTVHFPSRQGRFLLKCSGKCNGNEVVMMTSHLESTKPGMSARLQQFKLVCSEMSKESKQKTVIFGADTNLRDHEVEKVKKENFRLFETVKDVWELLGSPADLKYSWDLQKNDNQIQGGSARLRFERMYTTIDSPLKIKSMRFIGTERLECGLFPSDHWGLFTEFKV